MGTETSYALTASCGMSKRCHPQKDQSEKSSQPKPVNLSVSYTCSYRGADKSLAQPTSRYILFYGETISFDASLVIFINNTNIPLIMIINRIYETQNLLTL
jgi:hypothetical protein